MLKQLEEYGKYVEITGFRGIKIADAKAFAKALSHDIPEGVEVQLFNADIIAGWQHLYFAVLNALSAFKTSRNKSKSLSVETALYASTQRQIKKALEQIGLRSSSENVAVLVIGEDVDSVRAGIKLVSRRFRMKPDETVLRLSEAKIKSIRREFDVSDVELEAAFAEGDADQALIDLIIERVALLSTRL
jgi:tRNA threonylcarbamoyladenosine modification (KEOPS) complex Cgi121 subunit